MAWGSPKAGPLKLELGNSVFTCGGFGGAAHALEPLLPDTHANGHEGRVAERCSVFEKYANV